MDSESKVASGYGEADIEAKAMSKAASSPKSQVADASQVLAKAGATEGVIATHADDKVVRSKKN